MTDNNGKQVKIQMLENTLEKLSNKVEATELTLIKLQAAVENQPLQIKQMIFDELTVRDTAKDTKQEVFMSEYAIHKSELNKRILLIENCLERSVKSRTFWSKIAQGVILILASTILGYLWSIILF